MLKNLQAEGRTDLSMIFIRRIQETSSTDSSYARNKLKMEMEKQKEEFTSRPKNLPIAANKCKILLLLKLVNTSAADILP